MQEDRKSQWKAEVYQGNTASRILIFNLCFFKSVPPQPQNKIKPNKQTDSSPGLSCTFTRKMTEFCV